MFNFKKKNKKGFTLTEMLVTVLIISVLAAISSPIFLRAVERTRAAQGVTTLQDIAKAQTAYNAKRGRYAVSLLPLPLDLKDKEGQDVYGAAFSDRFFDFTVYGDDQAQAVADRSTGRYQLLIDYATGKLYCNPSEEYICQSLGLESKEAPITSCKDGDFDCYRRISYTGNYCRKEDNITECINYENGIGVSSCYLEFGYCKSNWGVCIMNDDGSGCAESDFSGIKCNSNDVCINFENGKGTFNCNIFDWKCFRENKATGVVCPPGRPSCDIYNEGTILDKCPVNQTGDGCLKNAMVCYSVGSNCEFTDENGYVVGQCQSNKSGDGCNDEILVNPDYTGTLCDTSQGLCFNYENGKQTGTCTSNAAGTGCSNRTVECQNGICTIYEGGESTGETCVQGPECFTENQITGVYCEGNGTCYSLENGRYTHKCKKDICKLYDENEVEIGTCPMSNSGASCAKNELVCRDGVCHNYNESGEETFTCNADQWDCFEYNHYTGETCYSGECKIFKNGKPINACVASLSGNTCAANELICQDNNCEYFDENGNKTFSCKLSDVRCFSDNNYSGAICTNESEDRCDLFKDGNEAGYCIANADGTGCAKMTAQCYTNDRCDVYKDGNKTNEECSVDNLKCFSDSYITGTYCSKANGTCSTFENGELMLECAHGDKDCIVYHYENDVKLDCREDTCRIFSNGDETGACVKNATGTGCATMTLECQKEECLIYKDGESTGKGCKEGHAECYSENLITGTYCSSGTCYNYEHGQVVLECSEGSCHNKAGDECLANTSGTACATMTAQCNGGMCSIYNDGKETGNKCEFDYSDCFSKNFVTGTSCDDSLDSCITYENGTKKIQCRPSKQSCSLFDEEGNHTGACVKSNSGNACAKNELVCYGKECNFYGANGQPVFTCSSYDDIGCYAKKNFSGTACYEGQCSNYEKGILSLICYQNTGSCDFYDNGKPTGEACPINDSGDGCAE